MASSKDILTIETLEKFERVINRDKKRYDLDMLLMPGTLEDKHRNCETIPALRRQFHLIYLLLSGEHDVKLGADQFWLKPNDLVIVPENMVYASDHIRNCKGYCIHFKTEFIQPLVRGSLGEQFHFFHFDSQHIIHISDEESLLIQKSFTDIIREYERFSPEKDLILQNFVLILLHRVAGLYTRHIKTTATGNSRGENLASQFIRVVEKNFTRVRSVTAYADMLHVTPKHLSAIVRKSTGRSPLEVIHDMLFLEARVLLNSTNKTASEIAHDLGFEDHAHFSHFIKKRTGVTPQEWRKKNAIHT